MVRIMTDTYETPGEPEVQIHFTKEPDPELQQAVNRSIRAMAVHSSQVTDQKRAEEFEKAELTSLADDALLRQIKADPAAASALAEILARPLGPETLSLSEVTPKVVGALPPYDYSWSWHYANGAPPFQQVIEGPIGHAALLAKSGQGGAGKFVNAHAGFGIAFRSGATRVMRADSQRRVTHGYVVGAKGFGSNATVEGGVECTFFEDGQFRKGDTRRIFRRRASVNETFVVNPGTWVTDAPMPLEYPLVAGHGYNFNVGVWVYTDNTSGVGTSAAKSVCQALIQSMWVV
jgi:hypothetical protein